MLRLHSWSMVEGKLRQSKLGIEIELPKEIECEPHVLF